MQQSLVVCVQEEFIIIERTAQARIHQAKLVGQTRLGARASRGDVTNGVAVRIARCQSIKRGFFTRNFLNSGHCILLGCLPARFLVASVLVVAFRVWDFCTA